MQTKRKSRVVDYWCRRFTVHMPVDRHWNLLNLAELELDWREFHEVRRYAARIRKNTREANPDWGR